MTETIILYKKPLRKTYYGASFDCQPMIEITEESIRLVISPKTKLFWSKKGQEDLITLFRISEILMKTEEDIKNIDFPCIYNFLLKLDISVALNTSELEINLEDIINEEALIEIMKKPIPEEIRSKSIF